MWGRRTWPQPQLFDELRAIAVNAHDYMNGHQLQKFRALASRRGPAVRHSVENSLVEWDWLDWSAAFAAYCSMELVLAADL